MKNIKLVLFDVDGVMTDGSIYINELGEDFKKFNVKDG
jgi:3-deoxy-D-manno-octulosonate 8-phosphate phosphatase (KDO 8-P phosphatase)